MMRRHLPAGLAAVLVLCAAASARAAHAPAAGSPQPAESPVAPAAAPAAGPGTNVLLVSIDTLRRDHVSCYGHDVLTTPNVDRLAAEGMRFTNAQGVVPITGPSHVSMMTGLYPQVHGAFRNGVRVADDKVTLAELLKAQGYRTGAVVSGWTLRDVQCGLAQGFETYDDAGMDERYSVVNLMRRADAVTDSAIKWFDAGPAADSRPWFLFVHYFDPHEPYDLPQRMDLKPNPAKKDLPRGQRLTAKLADYDNEIAFADAQLGRLIEHLRSKGALKNTLIVFTADHGQSFGDNGYGGAEGAHGRKVYQTQVAVPLIVWQPGKILQGAVNDLPVSHLDIMPTVADMLGLAAKTPAGLPGFSLAKVSADASAPAPWGRARRTRYGLAFRGAVGNKWNIFRFMQNKDVEQADPLCAYVLTDDGRKVIVDFANKKKVEIYDLAKDPAELVNLAGHDVPDEVAQDQGSAVFAWYGKTRAAQLTTAAPSAEDLEKMCALGYVE